MKTNSLHLRCDEELKTKLIAHAEKLNFEDVSSLVRAILRIWIASYEKEMKTDIIPSQLTSNLKK